MTRTMVHLLVGQLPAWTHRDHPILRYELGKVVRPSWQARYGRALAGIVGMGLLLLISLLVATDQFRHPAGQTTVEAINLVLFWPMLVVQVVLSIVALTMTANLVSDEMRRQNWDSLRATEHGTEMAMRARWVSVFYRLRGLIGLIITVRVVLIGLMLWELTGFQGRYLDLLINGIAPEVPLVAAVLLLSFTMTAALLLPLTTVGFDAAFGLLISALIQPRTYTTLILGVLIFVRILLIGVLLFGATQFLGGQLAQASDAGAWLLMAGYGVVGDWGLAFLHLGRYSEIWATIPYGIFLGLLLLLVALAQAALADRVLLLAVRRAQKIG